MIRLSVNVNKVATLRNSRGGRVPGVLDAVNVCVNAGAPGITVHPRGDQRHITPVDVREIAAVLKSLPRPVEYNLEGDPRPDFLELVAEVRPAQCVAPAAVQVPPGDGWAGCGNGFAIYGSMGLSSVIPDLHPSAIAIARLAAPRLAAGEGVDAALAAPVYVRDKVAFTTEERNAR